MEQSINEIKNALVNSLSLDAGLRDQAQNFLIKQCEPDPNFQTALLHIIKSYSTQVTVLDSGAQYPGSGQQSLPAERTPSQEDIQIQYQAILCMKNSLTRLL